MTLFSASFLFHYPHYFCLLFLLRRFSSFFFVWFSLRFRFRFCLCLLYAASFLPIPFGPLTVSCLSLPPLIHPMDYVLGSPFYWLYILYIVGFCPMPAHFLSLSSATPCSLSVLLGILSPSFSALPIAKHYSPTSSHCLLDSVSSRHVPWNSKLD